MMPDMEDKRKENESHNVLTLQWKSSDQRTSMLTSIENVH